MIPANVESVVLVDPEGHTGALLGRYLESRGWSVTQVADARSAVRIWRAVAEAPLLVLRLDEDDPDAFELLGALVAGALPLRAVVCASPGLLGLLGAVAPAGVERVLPSSCRFSEVASALDELRDETVVTQEAS
jgi:CheY-like chemotaxis protein